MKNELLFKGKMPKSRQVVQAINLSYSELSVDNGHAVLWLTEISAKSKSAFKNLYRLTA